MLSLEESVKAMSLSAEEDDIPWDSLRDNRDLTVFTSWDPKERSSQFAPPPSTTTAEPSCICVRVFPSPSQTVSRGAPAPVPGGGDGVAESTLPHPPPRRRRGLAGTHGSAERRDIQRERDRRQGVRPRQPAGAAQPDFTDGSSAGRETRTGV